MILYDSSPICFRLGSKNPLFHFSTFLFRRKVYPSEVSATIDFSVMTYKSLGIVIRLLLKYFTSPSHIQLKSLRIELCFD